MSTTTPRIPTSPLHGAAAARATDCAATAAAPPATGAWRPRRLERLVQGQATQDGAGVQLTRVLAGPALQQRLDPFLMLDAFASDRPGDYIAGFPDHPHRGFETITYLVAGRMRHRDSAGHEGLLGSGGVQWMTAGRGLVHSEMPEQQDGLLEGFQLWLNLPAATKMQAPGYRDIPAGQIPHWHGDGVDLRVIAGHSQGVAGAVQRPDTEPLLLDLQLQPGAAFDQPLPAHHHAMVYVYRGALQLLAAQAPADQPAPDRPFDRTVDLPVDHRTERKAQPMPEPAGDVLPLRHLAILAQDPEAGGVRLRNPGQEPARALLIAGAPLREPIVQHGPFVMNTRDEVMQALADYRDGRLR